MLAAVLGAGLMAAVPALAISPAGDRLANPGAEDVALTGWTGQGWFSAAYGEPERPAGDDPARAVYGDGDRLFAATTAGTLSQVVNVADLADQIDDPPAGSSGLVMSFGGSFGAPGASSASASVSVQPLDAADAPVGTPAIVGHPTARDRGSKTTLIVCAGQVALPIGARKVSVNLNASGVGALADALFLTSVLVGVQPSADGTIAADGPGCSSRDKLPGIGGQQPPPLPPPCAQPTPTPAQLTSKLQVARATISRRDGVLDVLAPITSLASGTVNVELHAAGRRFRFTAAIDSRGGRVRFRKRIPAAQANMGTGIVTIRYDGDADTRPQTVRLRAANRSADLRVVRPTIDSDGRLRASGRISRRARGVVRMQLEYVADGKTTLALKAKINNGRWAIDEQLSPSVRAAVMRRIATVHSYTLFTGYMPARMRGEMRSLQVVGKR